jgi:hypothetical protein
VGAGEVEPPSSSVSDPTSLYQLVSRTGKHWEGSSENRSSTKVSVPEPSDDLPQFSKGRVDPHRSRLLPVCCPDAVSQSSRPQSEWLVRGLPASWPESSDQPLLPRLVTAGEC